MLIRDWLLQLRNAFALRQTPRRRRPASRPTSAWVQRVETRVMLSANPVDLTTVVQTQIAPGVYIENGTIDAADAETVTNLAAGNQVYVITATSNLNGAGLQFNLIAPPGMDPNALAGFQAAANLWSQILTDDIVVNINIGFSALGSGTLAQASSTTQAISVSAYLAALGADITSIDDLTAVANLPTGPGLSLYTSNPGSGNPELDNNGTANNLFLDLNTTLAKALGLRAAGDAAIDASITFSSSFNFDFDRSDGISAGAFDFVGIAVHEIGHALGFRSGADAVDFLSGAGPGAPQDLNGFRVVTGLDLFRFSADSITAGADIDISADTRTKYFSIDGGNTQLTTFSTGNYNGNGDQASHWLDSLGIGVMDPTFSFGEYGDITLLDVRAFDVMGWNVKMDYGDAQDTANGTSPANYATNLSDDGPRHYLFSYTGSINDPAGAPKVYLGFGATTDIGGVPNVDATGDDDDGINVATLPIFAGGTTVNVTVRSSGNGAKLDYFFDFNSDGDFADPGETFSATLTSTVQAVPVVVPTNVISTGTVARFRISTAGLLGPTGAAADGEVEDYFIALSPSNVNNPPTVSLQNTTTFLPDGLVIGSPLKVADIVITDEGFGVNNLTLSGADAALFQINGTSLELISPQTLDAGTNPVLDVTVEVDDSTVGGTPDDTASLTIQVLTQPVPDPAGEFRVNTTIANNQNAPQIAMDADGDYVVVWVDAVKDTSGPGIYAQLYDRTGAARGGEFKVNTTVANAQTQASVAMDADGDFVVTWTDAAADASGSGVYAQRFSAFGTAVGTEFRVNSFTTGNQSNARVAMNVGGDFIIVWTSNLQDGAGDGIYGQLFAYNGTRLGGEFRVNTTTVGDQQAAAVAMDGSGDFVVAWQGNGNGDSDGIFAQRFDSQGQLVGGQFRVNTTTLNAQTQAAVATDLDGDFVISWTSDGQDGDSTGVYARRYDSAGAAQSGEIQVHTTTAGSQSQSSIAMDVDGEFIVSWTSTDADGEGVSGQAFSRQATKLGAEFPVNTTTTANQNASAIAMNHIGTSVIVWTSATQDGDLDGVYGQRYVAQADASGPIVTDVLVGANRLRPNQTFITPPGLTSLVVVFSEDLDNSGVDRVTNTANWRLTRDGVDVSPAILSVTYAFNAATNKFEATVNFLAVLVGDYVLTATDVIRDVVGNRLDGNFDSTPGGDFDILFRIRPDITPGTEFRVNTTTANTQRTWSESPQAVALDADGDFVVTWTGAQDGGGDSIHFQRYNRNGVLVGVETQVNTFTTGNQRWSTVAADADGDFIVTWSSIGQDGDGYGVYARRFDRAGNPRSTEFRVNTFTTGDQRQSMVAASSNGEFVIVWESVGQDGSASGIYGQRYDRDGHAVGSEFRINQTTADIQRFASVSMDADGDFVVTWSSNLQDGSGYGIYARVYDRNGVAVGGEFAVNTFAVGNQIQSDVAMDFNGDIVVTWTSAAQDGSVGTVMARRFTHDEIGGTVSPAGGEFQVNTFTTGEQRFSSVAIDDDGDFVITWTSTAQDGNLEGVFAQRYDQSGGTVGAQFQVNTFTTNNQQFSSVGMDRDGNFVIVWDSTAQDGSGEGVYARQFRASTDFSAPIWTDVLARGTPLEEGGTLLSPVNSLGMSFSEDMLAAGGSRITNPANWTVTLDGEDITSDPNRGILNITYGLNAATQKFEATINFRSLLLAGDYTITLNDLVRDVAGNQFDGDRDHVELGTLTRTFSIRDPHSVNGEQLVNSDDTVFDQISGPRAVASDANGNYVVVWLNQFGTNQNPDFDVYARLYSSTGVPLTNEIIVDSANANAQHASVAMDSAGNFLITWTIPNSGVVARRYDATGSPLGARFQLSLSPSARNPTIALKDNGGFIVTYTSSDGNGDGVYARMFDAGDNPITGEFLVNVTTTNNQKDSVIGMDAGGDFVVAWTSFATDGSGEGVYARKFDRFGSASSGEFRVNTTVASDQRHVSVAMDSDGDFVVAWAGDGGQDGSSYGIFAQRYSAGAVAQGTEFQANITAIGSQRLARVAMDADGDFTIAWASAGQDGSADGIFLRRYDRNGVAITGEVQVNEFFAGNQTNPSIAMGQNGDVAVVWNSIDQDGSGYGVYTQLFHGGNRPVDFDLDDSSVPRNSNANTVVGRFVTIDVDPNETFVYEFATGAGDDDNAFFYIVGDELRTAGALNPARTSYSIRVRVVDGGGLSITKTFTIDTTDINQEATISLVNTVTVLPELTSTVNPIRVADIVVTDDGIGTNTLSLSGADAGLFEIVGSQLFLKAGTVLDYEDNPFLDVTVNVDDATIGGTPDDSASLTITITRLPQTPPTLANFGANLSYTELAPPILITTTATVTDPDSPNFNTGRLTVSLVTNGEASDRLTIRHQGFFTGQVGIIGNQVYFSNILVGTFTGGDGLTPLVVTFNRSSSAAAAQAVLRNVTYSNISANPSTLLRTLRVNLTDGDGGTSVNLQKTITVVAVNTAPTIASWDTPVVYNQGSIPVILDADATVTDPDSANFAGGVMTISYSANGNAGDRLAIRNQGVGAGLVSLSGSSVLFSGVVVGTWSGGTGTTALTISFNANSTAAAAQAILRNITFQHVTTPPVTTPRTVRVVLTDGDGGTSTAVAKTVTVVKVNQPPVIGAFAGNINFGKGSAPIIVDSDATILDPDSLDFQGGVMTIELIGGGQSTDRLAISPQGNGAGQINVTGANVLYGGQVIGTFTGGIGTTPLVISFNIRATPAGVQALLRRITFAETAANPTPGQRTIQVSLTDGDGAAATPVTKTITVTLTAPSITGLSAAVTWTEGTAPVLLEPAAVLNDADSNRFTSLRVEFVANGTADDRIGIRNQGVAAGQIGVSGINVLYGGVQIGTFSGGIGTNPLVVTLNANATRLAVQALLRNLTFSNVSDSPSTVQRTVTIGVTDDDGLTSNPVTQSIRVVAANDGPVISGFDTPVTYTRGGPPVILDNDAIVTDPDQTDFNAGKLTVQLITNVQATDRLLIRNEGSGPNQLSVVGSNLIYNGLLIGTFTGGSGTTALVVTFNTNSSAASVQAVLRNITYSSTIALPSTLTRTVRVGLTDGDGGSSTLLTKSINIV